MKRTALLATLIVGLVIGLVMPSCTLAGGTETEASVTTDTPVTDDTPISTDTPATDAPPSNTATGTDTGGSSGGSSGGSAMIWRGDLEDICTPERVHNITSATFVGYETDAQGFVLPTFETVTNYFGLEMNARFSAYYGGSGGVFITDPDDILFEEGVTYLLLLHRYRNVYAEADEFQITDGTLIIPMEDFRSSTLDGQPLAERVQGLTITEDTTPDTLLAYLLEMAADHPPYTGVEYIHSDDLADIVAQSPYVVTLTTASVTSDMSIKTVTIRCRVDQVHKGSLTAGEYIDVMFPLEADIGLGQTLVLTLSEPYADWYRYSCKKAAYSVSELDGILALLGDAQPAA